VYTRLDSAGRQIARRLLLRMIKIAEDSETRRRVDRAHLVDELPDPAAAEAVLEELATARLVTLAETTAEIAHDVLLRAWPQLRDWIDADRAGLLIHQRLTEEAETWARENRDPSGLYRGPRLAEARAWVDEAGHHAELTSLAREFIDASADAERREQRAEQRRNSRLRLYVAVVTVLFVVAAGATVYAVWGQRTATAQRNEAQSRQVAGAANASLQSRSVLALLLSVQAYRIHPTTESRDGLLSTQAHYLAARIPTRGPAGDVAFSPDGRTITVADHAGLEGFDAASHRRLRTTLEGHPVYGVAHSPDGHVLAFAENDGSVTLWDDRDEGRDGRYDRARVLPPGPRGRGPAYDVAFSADGGMLAGAGHDGVVWLWDVPRRRIIAELNNDLGPVESVAFAPDGRTLASVGADATVAIWDVSTHKLRTRLRGHVGPVRSVAFSPNGRALASGGDDGSVRLWDARSHEPLGTPLIGHIGPVRSVAFSPNGRVLASGGDDGGVRLWDADSGGLLTPLTGPAGAVAAVTFSPDGGMLAGANADSSVGLWRLGGLGRGGPDFVHAMTVRPDGTAALLATADADRMIRLWDVRTGRRVAVLSRRGPERARRTITALAFGSDGRLLAAADGAGVTLWRLSSDAEPRARQRTELSGAETRPVTAMAFSPDGRTVAGATDRTLTLWNVADGRTTAPLTPHPSPINVIAFSPDGRTVATGTDEGTVSLTQVPGASGGMSTTSSDCSDHIGPVRALAFSPRGDLLASAGADHTVKLWRPAPCRPLLTFDDHTQTVGTVAFSPDGRRLASAGLDEFINVWEVVVAPDEAETSKKQIASLRSRSGVSTLIFGATGDTLLSVDSAGWPLVWDTDPGRVIDRICAARPTLPAESRHPRDPSPCPR
jgi:WD40 repeat protein